MTHTWRGTTARAYSSLIASLERESVCVCVSVCGKNASLGGDSGLQLRVPRPRTDGPSPRIDGPSPRIDGTSHILEVYIITTYLRT